MHPRMQKILVPLLAATAFIASGMAVAQSYPSKPVKIVVGFGAGGVTDVLNRIMADQMSKVSGGSFIVENRPGAGGLLAAQTVRIAAPDGYTLFGGSVATYTPVFIKESLSADKDLSPISSFARGDWFMYVPTSLGVTNAKELAAYAKANDGKFRFASPAKSNTMLMAMVAKQQGFKFEDIPYKTTDQTIQALLTGDGHVTFNAASSFPPHIQSGKLRAIAVGSPQRVTVLPDVKTIAEQGFKGFDAVSWGGLLAPLGTPKAIVDRVAAECSQILAEKDIQDKLLNVGAIARFQDPAQLAQRVEQDYTKWGKVIQAKGLAVD